MWGCQVRPNPTWACCVCYNWSWFECRVMTQYSNPHFRFFTQTFNQQRFEMYRKLDKSPVSGFFLNASTKPYQLMRNIYHSIVISVLCANRLMWFHEKNCGQAVSRRMNFSTSKMVSPSLCISLVSLGLQFFFISFQIKRGNFSSPLIAHPQGISHRSLIFQIFFLCVWQTKNKTRQTCKIWHKT